MLVIRMQRTGRKGHAMFRVVVQDSRRTPTSGKIVAALGSYDPHSKTSSLNKEKAQFYLEHGAQPSDRVAALLKKEGVKLPSWVTLADKKEGKIRNQDKLRRNQPAQPVEETPEAPAEEPANEEVPAESADTSTEAAEQAETQDDSVASAAEVSPEASAEAEPEKPAEEAAA